MKEFSPIAGLLSLGLVCLHLSPALIQAQSRAGQPDPSFQPPPLNGPVNALLIQADGKIVIGGEFSLAGAAARVGVARLNPDGSPDEAFNQGAGLENNGIVRTLALQSDGRILIAGDFKSYNGVARMALARLNGDGSLDADFNPDPLLTNRFVGIDTPLLVPVGYYGEELVPQGPRPGVMVHPYKIKETYVAGIHTVAVTREGHILIGGAFRGRVESDYLAGVARLRADGRLDESHKVVVGPRLAGSFLDLYPTIRYLEALPDGGAYVAGDRNGHGYGTFGAERRHANGTLDPSFAPRLRGESDNGVLAAVVTPAFGVQADGRILISSFYSDSGFLSFGTPQKFNARVFARLRPDEASPESFDSYFIAPNNLDVRCLHIQPDGRILVYGNLSALPGHTNKSLARLNSQGGLDPDFDAGAGPDGEVRAIKAQVDGKILLAGDFQKIDQLPSLRLARLLGDDLTLGPPVIRRQPEGAVVGEGQTLNVSVIASGSPAGFQWRRNGQALPGATNASFTVPAFRPANTGNYDVMITNALGSVASSVARFDILTLREAGEGAGVSFQAGYYYSTGTFGEFRPNERVMAQTRVTHDGMDAIEFLPSTGTVFQGSRPEFRATFTGPGTFSVWWRGSTDCALNINLRNTQSPFSENKTWPGSTNWQKATVTLREFKTVQATGSFTGPLNTLVTYLDELRFEPEAGGSTRFVPVTPVLEANATLNLNFPTVEGQKYELSISPDLADWYFLRTIDATNSLTTVPWQINGPRMFFGVLKQAAP